MLRWLFRASFGVVLLAGIYCGADHLSAPAAIHRLYHDNGQIAVECPLDAAGRMHGEMRSYHPSGRLKRVQDVVHGSMGSGVSYEDDREDSELTD